MILDAAKPIPIKDRLSYIFLERGNIDVLDGAFVLVDKEGVRTHIPVGGVTCLFLEPGIRVSHAAAKLAGQVGCLLVWVGEAGVRMYAAGQPGGASGQRLLYQASLVLDETARLKVVRAMFTKRFGEEPPARRSIDQLRGIEGIRVREIYKRLAREHKVKWTRRNYNPKDFQSGDLLNQCLSMANAALYGVTEAAILAAGYAPALGFVHSGKPRSFVYDVADLIKFDTVVPVAFSVAARVKTNHEQAVRQGCRDAFRKSKLMRRLIPLIDEILAAGGKEPPKEHGIVAPAIIEEKGLGDVGFRS